MRPEHLSRGDPCTQCGLAAARHRRRYHDTPERRQYMRAYKAAWRAKNGRDSEKGPRRILAIDGEGYTTKDGRHLYTYMAACDGDELVSELSRPRGIRSAEVWSWLCTLPKSAMLVGFALGYDRTKWIEDWPDELVYKLCRPELRRGGKDDRIIFPVEQGGYRVNLLSTRFSVTRQEDRAHRTVWDLFKFFQSSFVKALERWSIGTAAERAHILSQKKRRKDFERIGQVEKEYCQLECILLARLARALIEAHDEEGFKLRSYFGPGSSAACLLAELGARKQTARVPEAMMAPVLTAYFGGRFEDAWVGPVREKELYAYDLASAYPWALCQLPCFRHGRWVHGTGRPDSAWALVRYRVDPHPSATLAWGPLPHRLPDGNIVFPVVSAGGWAWEHEVCAAQDLHPGVKILEAWQWESACRCEPPFRARVEELYARRLVWGKAARGIVLKLILNSLYGKSAQSVGRGRYRCMVRAGLVTSLTRARLLTAVASASDPWDVLELATDSVLCRKALPIEGKGLGAWECKPWPGGAFLMRPGLRFALEKKEDRTAARGVGTKVLHKNRARVLRQWEKEPMAPITLATPSFFHGSKLSVRSKAGAFDFDEAQPEYVRDALYGTWTDEMRTLRYTPHPKRESVAPDFRLVPWILPQTPGSESVPYGKAPQSLIADELERMRELLEDQDDGGGLELV